MALSTPTQIANKGNAWLVTTVAGAFVVEISLIPCVGEMCLIWRDVQKKQAALEGILRDRLRQRGYSPQHIARKLEQVQRESLEAERKATQNYLRASLTLKPTYVPWLADALHALLLQCEPYGPADAGRLQFAVPVPVPSDLPDGRIPREKRRARLESAVRTYCRLKVRPLQAQAKAETQADLAKDYAAWAGKETDAHSHIHNQCKQVEAILDRVTTDTFAKLTPRLIKLT